MLGNVVEESEYVVVQDQRGERVKEGVWVYVCVQVGVPLLQSSSDLVTHVTQRRPDCLSCQWQWYPSLFFPLNVDPLSFSLSLSLSNPRLVVAAAADDGWE